LKSLVKELENELIEACIRNDRGAQVKIYEKYSKAIFNTCARIIENSADAEDVMQESFIEAFRKLDTFRGEGGFGGWLKRIAVNNSINFIRKRKMFVSIEDNNQDIPDPANDEAVISENIFCQLEEIKNAMNQLNTSYKIVLTLHLLEGYDHDEIAEILGTTNGNVRTRFSRAKQKLLQLIMNSRN
jgi:RNA polymerase sigma-70 factor (ECF subfamily)